MRIVPLVAPTSRMMPISLRRANTAIRTVLPISAADATSMMMATASTPQRKMRGDLRTGDRRGRLLSTDLVDARLALEPLGDGHELLRVLQLHPERGRQRVGRHVVDQVGLVVEELQEPLVRLLLGLVADGLGLWHRSRMFWMLDCCAELMSSARNTETSTFASSLRDQVDLALHQQRAAQQEQRDERGRDGGEDDAARCGEAPAGFP